MATIRIKRSNTASATPSALQDGEIAINQADGKLWYRTSAGGVASFVSGVTDGSKGDITVSGSGATWTINANAVVTADIAGSAVTYAKIQNVSATDRLLGRSTAGAGVVEEIACTAAGRALIDDADAAAQRTTLGLGSISTQASSSVAITGGSINGTAIGATTASTGAFTTVSTTGNVGVGTASPNNLLVVSAADTSNSLTNSSAAITLVVANSAAFGRATNLNFNQGDSSAAQRIATIAGVYTAYSTSVGGSLAFSTADGTGAVTERMRLSHTGNLGVGTASPVGRLHVSGPDTAAIALVGGPTHGVRIGTVSAGGTIEAVDSTGSVSYQPLLIGGSEIRLRLSNSELARLTSTGLGIGRTAPASALDVNGVITASLGSVTAPALTFTGYSTTGIYSPGADQWAVTTGGVQRILVSAAGNVQVGAGAVSGSRYLDIANTDTGSSSGSEVRLTSANVAGAATAAASLIKYKNGQFSIRNAETDAAAFTSFTVGSTECLRVSATTSNFSTSLTVGGSAVILATDARLSDARTPLSHTQAASTITGLAAVATSGSYNDLTNQPTIPTFGRFLALC